MNKYDGDYKYWITCKADEIALEQYGVEFDELPELIREKVYAQAEEAYTDFYSSRLDHIYETMRDKVFNKGG